MEQTIRRNVKQVVEELDAAYSGFASHENMNGDYADFASMAVAQFRKALHNPTLTREELKYMLRSGFRAHKAHDTRTGWTTFIAAHIEKSSNANAVN